MTDELDDIVEDALWTLTERGEGRIIASASADITVDVKVVFAKTGTYLYIDVPIRLLLEWNADVRAGNSATAFLNTRIKPDYQCEKL